jgi:hypothetical protein
VVLFGTSGARLVSQTAKVLEISFGE